MLHKWWGHIKSGSREVGDRLEKGWVSSCVALFNQSELAEFDSDLVPPIKIGPVETVCR